jgi:hypothetical protein
MESGLRWAKEAQKEEAKERQMSRRTKAILIVIVAIAALVLVFAVPMLWRARRNDALARELHAEFDKWLASLPQVPDSENGAPFIMKGMQLLEDNELIEPIESGLNEGAELVRLKKEYLDSIKDAISLVERGLSYETWEYHIDYGRHYAISIPHLAWMRDVANAFLMHADFAKAAGGDGEAMEWNKKALRIALTLSHDRLLLSYFIQNEICEEALAAIISSLGQRDTSEKEVSNLLSDLRDWHGRRASFAESLDFEFYQFARCIADGITQDRSLHEIAQCMNQDGYSLERESGISAFVLSKRAYDFRADIDFVRKHVRERQALDPAHYYEFRDILPQMEDKDKDFMAGIVESKELFFARLSLPIIGQRTYAAAASGETFWRAAMVMAALRLYEATNGELPEKLDMLGDLVPKEILIDPFSGKQLVYRLEGGDFCLYSVGVDGKDGKCEETRKLFRTRADEGEPDDIIFHTWPKAEKAVPEPAEDGKGAKTPRRRKF